MTPCGFQFRPQVESLADRCAPSSLLDLNDAVSPISSRLFGMDAAFAQQVGQFQGDDGGESPVGPGAGFGAAAQGAANVGGTVTPNGHEVMSGDEVQPGSTLISGPGRYNYPDSSMVFVADKNNDGDADAIRGVAPQGTTVHENISNWDQIRRGLGNVPASSVGGLVISGHGLSDDDGEKVGVQTNQPNPNGGGGLYGILSNDLDANTADVINSRLAPGAPIILAACSDGKCVIGLQNIADKTGHPVIANTGHVNDGNNGKGNWVRVDPTVGPPAPPN